MSPKWHMTLKSISLGKIGHSTWSHVHAPRHASHRTTNRSLHIHTKITLLLSISLPGDCVSVWQRVIKMLHKALFTNLYHWS